MTTMTTKCDLCEAKYTETNKPFTRNGVSFCEMCVESAPFLRGPTNTPAPTTMSEEYYFHQTPRQCAKDLMPNIPLEKGDRVLEPFAGEGAFYDQLPDYVEKDWCEIERGRDYKDYDKEFDWVVSNPPFKIGGKNVIWGMIDYYTQRATKGVAFFVNAYGLTTLTPIRQAVLKERGWGITGLTMVNVKKWSGRYFLIVLQKGKPSVMNYLSGNY